MTVIDPNMLLNIDPQIQALGAINQQQDTLNALLNQPGPEMIQSRQVPGQKPSVLSVIGAALQDLATAGVGGGPRLGTPQALGNLQAQALQAQQQQAQLDRQTDLLNADLRRRNQERMDEIKVKLQEIRSKRQEFLAGLGMQKQEKESERRFQLSRDKAQSADQERLIKLRSKLDRENTEASIKARMLLEKPIDEFAAGLAEGFILPITQPIRMEVSELAKRARRGDERARTLALELIEDTMAALRSDLAPFGITTEHAERIDEQLERQEFALRAYIPVGPEGGPSNEDEPGSKGSGFDVKGGMEDAAQGVGRGLSRGFDAIRGLFPGAGTKAPPPEVSVPLVDNFIQAYIDEYEFGDSDIPSSRPVPRRVPLGWQ